MPRRHLSYGSLKAKNYIKLPEFVSHPAHPMLATLATELLCLILNELLSDPATLWNLCLVGDKRLYALALPLCWKEVHFVAEASEDISDFARRFNGFIASEQRVLAVRCLRFTFVEYHNHYPVYDLLNGQLERFANVTHAAVSFICVDPHDAGDRPLATVNMLVGYLPALVSIRVDGCFDPYAEPWSDCPLVPTLRHVATRYCGIELAQLWLEAPNLQVIELQGGDAKSFWSETAEGKYPGSPDDHDTGLGIEALLDVELLPKLTRLYLSHDVYPDTYAGVDESWAVIGTFEELADPLPLLQDLVLDIELTVEGFRGVWDSLKAYAPNIKRLKMSVGYERDCPESPEGIFPPEEAQGHFPSLEELSIPIDGLEEQEFVVSLLQNSAPRLNALFLMLSDEKQDDIETQLLSAAGTFAAELPQLKVISWRNICTVRVERDIDGIDGPPRIHTYGKGNEPSWAAEFQGVGGWWETST